MYMYSLIIAAFVLAVDTDCYKYELSGEILQLPGGVYINYNRVSVY